MVQTDEELVSQCLKGDSSAFEEIVSRYKKLVYSVVYKMIPDREEVNDVSQEVFIRLYKSLDKYNPEYKMSTWIVKITSNLCLDTLRKKKQDTVALDDAIGVSSNTDTPEEALIKNQRSQLIKSAINELPDKYKILITLFHSNGLSYEEMTKVLNEPMSIIKNRLYRARLMLKAKLDRARKEEIL
ncbi:RNA polymerase sigma-70 factor (ECF subfamily) [Ruminiclostridium sufflavum DSM 19573]|uniref:RNA polymerase sigma-70 factor (ECF subfamily) n=1 Tax=Ruminiclostridium sufflavum DSM 19573 TaxID=1121337 RepID=A0A318XJV4_9FIRM|nr:sigma-70 family RNA polymerase sigma factor [Ruminiclostridium sufflavum]PYG85697.1 RNA polymerase sigma-70 factor (ECF subfamily) [Ruminiclostridium sufflavum DSM 19573]